MKTELGITKGTAYSTGDIDKRYDQACINISTERVENFITVWSGNDRILEQDSNNANLIVDALNTANATGLLPSELLAQRDALKSYLIELKRVLSIETEMNLKVDSKKGVGAAKIKLL